MKAAIAITPTAIPQWIQCCFNSCLTSPAVYFTLWATSLASALTFCPKDLPTTLRSWWSFFYRSVGNGSNLSSGFKIVLGTVGTEDRDVFPVGCGSCLSSGFGTVLVFVVGSIE